MRDPRLATVDLSGRTLVDADAYGKHLFLRFDDGRTLHAHLLMTGSFEVGQPVARERVAAPGGAVARQRSADRCRGPAARHAADRRRARDHRRPRPRSVRGRAGRPTSTRSSSACSATRRRRCPGRCSISATPPASATSTPTTSRSSRASIPRQPIGSIDRLDVVVALGHGADPGERRARAAEHHRPPDAHRSAVGARRRPATVPRVRHAHAAPLRPTTPRGSRSVTWCPACQPQAAGRTADLARARRLMALHPAVRQAYVPPA